jgi:hypothetical protein
VSTGLDDAVREVLVELAPVARRALALDPSALARLRLGPGAATILARLPFDVLVSRTIALPAEAQDTDDSAHGSPNGGARDAAGLITDATVRADELIAWLDGGRESAPQQRDAQWRTGLPPQAGWRRIETVPDDIVRGLVRQGALALKDAQDTVGTHPSQAAADALLDSVVLTVSHPDDAGLTAGVALRTLSALTRMGFLPRGSHINVDVAGRWTRVAAAYGTVYAEAAGLSLALS